MDVKKVMQVFDKYLRPQCFPVGVRLLTSSEELPEKVRMPKKDFKIKMPLCQGVSIARKYGWTIAMTQEDMLCPLGSITLGFVPVKERFLEGDFNIPFWVKNKETRAKMAKNIPRLENGKFDKILLAPIHKMEFEPHVVIFYGNPAQISRLTQSVVYATGESVDAASFGGFACGFEITVPTLTGKPQIIIAGGGDRALAQTQDDEIAFAIPTNYIDNILEGLVETHKAGMRYPTTSFLMYQPLFPPDFDKLMEHLES
ncbi:MAG: DUF169 domain-containing protein [Deferribacterota bacterium]|nr:DUF169 domain-containing protein [Deferribacterota bacterium]